uniref:Uncharacterized protein n=1 Tax=Panagrolaimus davidi TaxID=227884 RepID=A0A914PI98_9BILA
MVENIRVTFPKILDDQGNGRMLKLIVVDMSNNKLEDAALEEDCTYAFGEALRLLHEGTTPNLVFRYEIRSTAFPEIHVPMQTAYFDPMTAVDFWNRCRSLQLSKIYTNIFRAAMVLHLITAPRARREHSQFED